MTRPELIELVKTKIDELTPFDGGLALITATGNTNLNPIETYIEQFLDESAKETLLEAPSRVLPMTAFETITYDLPNKKATLTLEDDYLRVGVLKFSTWERPVYSALYPGDPRYSKQFNRWLRGGIARPAAYYINVGGIGYLICYGIEAATDNEASYVAITIAEDMPDILLEPMTWHCAFQVLEVYAKDKASEMAYARYTKSLSLL
jgi:hypothetical protein